MRVIVTRVQPQAAQWVRLLSPHVSALALPLLQLDALADNSRLQAAARQWASYRAVMFVSAAAVDYFFAAAGALLAWQLRAAATATRVWCTGPATRAALLAQSVAVQTIDAPAQQFDSEALWQQVGQQISPGQRVLIVRGDQAEFLPPECDVGRALASGNGVGRDWLAQTLRQAGAAVDFVVAYRRSMPVWDQAQRALASQAASDGSIWLFSSAQALSALQALLPQQSWSQARAVATHPRIARAARKLDFGCVQQAQPDLLDILASIESLA